MLVRRMLLDLQVLTSGCDCEVGVELVSKLCCTVQDVWGRILLGLCLIFCIVLSGSPKRVRKWKWKASLFLLTPNIAWPLFK